MFAPQTINYQDGGSMAIFANDAIYMENIMFPSWLITMQVSLLCLCLLFHNCFQPLSIQCTGN